MVYLPKLSCARFRRQGDGTFIEFSQVQPPHMRNIFTNDFSEHFGKKNDIESGFFSIMYS